MNHSQDVGGGSVKNKTRYSLARIPLRWMVRECFKANTGILFKSALLRDIGLDPSMFYPDVLPRLSRVPVDSGSHHWEMALKEPSWIQRLLFPCKTESVKDSMISEEDEDLKDALSPIYDQLELKRGWWIVELLPLSFRHLHSRDKMAQHWRYVFSFSFL